MLSRALSNQALSRLFGGAPVIRLPFSGVPKQVIGMTEGRFLSHQSHFSHPIFERDSWDKRDK